MEKEKLKTLLREMTLEEKINQLFQGHCSFYEEKSISTGPVDRQGISSKTVSETGSILGTLGAEKLKNIQKVYMDKHPHKIPLLFMADIINGYKTIFPIPLAQGAAFNPEVAKTGAEIAAAESAAAGLHITFSPMVDLVRDARWGRVMETTGEDTYLNSVYAKALVEGYQGHDISEPGKIGACVKHFAAYGAPTAGRDYNNVELSERTLRDDYLPAYDAAIKAGVAMVMTSFNTLNRIPSSANKWLMRDVLRKEMGFEGVLISDWASIEEIEKHGLAADKKEAAKLALRAGVDIDMMTTCYCNNLKGLIEEGEIPESLIDEAVFRILELKNKLGLFENPYKDASEETEKQLLLCPEHRAKARKAAVESFVLLKNEGILPLKKQEKVAFIGPYADEKDIIGIWSMYGDISDSVTIREAMAKRDIEATFTKGCDMLASNQKLSGFGRSVKYNNEKEDAGKNMEQAISAAENAEKVVLCIGEHTLQSGEAASRGNITIPDIQKQLVKEIAKVNDNIVVLLFTGRPLDIRIIKDISKAILVVWLPGTEGGNAVTDVLYGEVSPSGKLPMSFPYAVGQVPVFYNEFNTGRKLDPEMPDERFQSKYLDIPNEPLYSFGYGLTYSKFEYSPVLLSSAKLTGRNAIQAKVTVKNLGQMKAKEVIQLYISDEKGSVIRPVRELKGFQKVSFEPGESKEIIFTITEEQLKFHDINMNNVVESGNFTVFIGPDSETKNAAVFYLENEKDS